MELNLVTQGGKPVIDENNNILLCNKEGNYIYVPRHVLPQNFLEQASNSEASETNEQPLSEQTNAQPQKTWDQQVMVEFRQTPEQAEHLPLKEQEIRQSNLELENEEQAEPLNAQIYQQLNAHIETTQHQVEPLQFIDQRAHWTRSQILQLIAAYKDNINIFRSNTLKNSMAWRIISQIVGRTPKQCEAKFKYLKTQYIKKKDNTSNRSSGAQALTFEYFEEMDEIFRAEPNIEPLSLASSTVVHATAPATETEQSDLQQSDPQQSGNSGNTRPIRRRRSRLEIQFERFQKSIVEREAAREKRMERFIQVQERSTNRICDLLENLINKM